MPTATYRISAVYPVPTRQQGVTRYQVCATTEQGAGIILDTVNPLRASLCERARDTNQPVEIGWRETKWGPELITVALVPSRPAEGASAAAYLSDPLFAAETK